MRVRSRKLELDELGLDELGLDENLYFTPPPLSSMPIKYVCFHTVTHLYLYLLMNARNTCVLTVTETQTMILVNVNVLVIEGSHVYCSTNSCPYC